MNDQIPEMIAVAGEPGGPVHSRRFFLRGAGRASLSIPVLPSLLSPRQARAAENANEKIFVAFVQEGSTLWNSNNCPQPEKPDEVMAYAGGTIQRTALAPQPSGNNVKLSEVLQAPASLLTPRLLGKMNVIRGCDWPKPTAHNRSQLGNFGAGPPGNLEADLMRPSIDVLMSWSKGFYPTFNGIKRALYVGTSRGGMSSSWAHQNPLTRTGPIDQLSGEGIPDPSKLFDILFGSFTPPAGESTAPRKPVVDLVLESYRRLSRLHPRLSQADRERLDDHVQRISDIERRLQVSIPVSCAVPNRPASARRGDQGDGQVAYYNAFHDIVVAALACGLTRIVVYHVPTLSVPDGINMHHDVEHHCMQLDGVAQGRMVKANQRAFAEVLLPFVAKLDAATDAGGKSLLDRSLVLRACEMGEMDHSSSGQMFVTFGGANGAVRTGNFLDYRNLSGPSHLMEAKVVPEIKKQFLGLTIQQFYGTLLRVMGVPHAEWAEGDHGGYGKKIMGKLGFLHCCAPPPPERFYTDKVWAAAGDVLPWFGA